MTHSGEVLAGDENPVALWLLRHLKQHSATCRITSALTITAWLHASQEQDCQLAGPQATPAGAVIPQPVSQALFGCLAEPAVAVTAEGTLHPYAELASMYSAMQTQAQVCIFCPTLDLAKLIWKNQKLAQPKEDMCFLVSEALQRVQSCYIGSSTVSLVDRCKALMPARSTPAL